MCGIVGIIGNYNVSKDVYKGLKSMKNRGTNSSGEISHDGQYHEKKGVGRIDIVCSDSDLDSLVGDVAIGQNRYSTVGSDLYKDAQPHRVGPIAMAHNGNILNILDLKKEIGAEKITTDCDVIYPLHLVARSLKDKLAIDQSSEDFFNQSLAPCFENVLNKTIGAYSIVSIIGDRGLIALRDIHGIRPLFLGKTLGSSDKKGYAFVSETSALDPNFIKDYTLEKEVGRGELIYIDSNLNLFSRELKKDKEAFCVFEPVYFGDLNSMFKDQKVLDSRYNLGLAGARQFSNLKDAVDVIIPIPNTPVIPGIAISKSWDKPCGGIEKNIDSEEGKHIRIFQEPTKKKREDALRRKYQFIPEYFHGKRVLLVDDSLVRGETSMYIIEEARRLGATWVGLLVTYQPYRYPCFYGIDTPDIEKLIAHNRTEEEIRMKIKADWLGFLSLERILRATNLQGAACTACMTGEYPTPIDAYKEYVQLRKAERAKQP